PAGSGRGRPASCAGTAPASDAPAATDGTAANCAQSTSRPAARRAWWAAGAGWRRPRPAPRTQSPPPTGRCAWTSARNAPQQVEFIVAAHGHEIGHAVAQAEKGADGRDVPGVLVAEAMVAQVLEVGLAQLLRALRDRHGEVQ